MGDNYSRAQPKGIRAYAYAKRRRGNCQQVSTWIGCPNVVAYC